MAGKPINPKTVDGMTFGQSTTDKIGFYGLATPIVQPTLTLTTGSTTANCATDLAAIKAVLVALGLVA